MEGKHAYQMYMALKLHFSGDYNYFKYNGKTQQISDGKFEARKDHIHFARIERRYKDKLEEFFVANFVHNPNFKWAGDLVTVDAEKCYNNYKKVIESFSYNFRQDLKKINEKEKNSLLLLVKDGGHPLLLQYLLGNEISIETAVALDIVTGYVAKWDKTIRDPIIWPDQSRLIKKYRPFLQLDKTTLQNIVIDELFS